MSDLAPDFESDPVLLVGLRKPSGSLEVSSVRTHMDVFDTLRAPGEAAWADLSNRTPIAYQIYGAIESDEYYVIDVDDLPQRPVGRKPRTREDNRPTEEAGLVSMVREADGFAPVNATHIADYGYNFYTTCYHTADGEIVGFVRQISPTKALDRAFIGASAGILRRVQEPAIAIDGSVDIIVTPTQLLVLRPHAAESLLRDVRLVFEKVAVNMTTFSAKLARLHITPVALEATRGLCAKSTRAAKRLDEWATGAALLATSPSAIRQALRARQLDHVLVGNQLDFGPDDVLNVLDCLSGRLYKDGISGEERRADKFATR